MRLGYTPHLIKTSFPPIYPELHGNAIMEFAVVIYLTLMPSVSDKFILMAPRQLLVWRVAGAFLRQHLKIDSEWSLFRHETAYLFAISLLD